MPVGALLIAEAFHQAGLENQVKIAIGQGQRTPVGGKIGLYVLFGLVKAQPYLLSYFSQ